MIKDYLTIRQAIASNSNIVIYLAVYETNYSNKITNVIFYNIRLT